jgi:hypothetical protein
MDGHEGLYVELTTPDRFDYQACGTRRHGDVWETGVEPRVLDEPITDRYCIMDVDGHRVVISAMTVQEASRETVDLAMGVVKTVAFVAPG